MSAPWVSRRNAIVGGAIALVAVVIIVLVAVGGGDDPSTPSAGKGASDSSVASDQRERSTDSGSSTADTAGEVPGSTSPASTDPAATTLPPDPVPDDGTAPADGGTTGGAPGSGGTGGTPATPPPTLPPPPVTPPGTAPTADLEPRTEAGSGVPSGPCTPTGPPKIASAVHDGASPPGHGWVVLGASSGNCGNGGGGPVIRTSDRDTRIVFRSDADQFLAFLVDLDDPDSNAGYADVDCRSACSDQGVLILKPGTYRLDVQATDGPWEVSVQEYR